jgi:uncharacterized membrane protein
MTFFFLSLIVIALFSMLLFFESTEGEVQIKPSGLLTWLVSGNWPAKVGAALVIVGVGALLRYAFANIDLPSSAKLGGGVFIAAVLGFTAMTLKNVPKRRAIYLALAGAGFGVAYLTAYSAYGILNYINSVNALTLLALVASAAGVFAVSNNVMSVAILAMVGAYIAPRFAIGEPGVLAVYGYYFVASILSLIMIQMRGWRPLIHLSFLFTLAGALFFGWHARFFEAQHFHIMLPMLLALAAIHLLMPLLEHTYVRSNNFMRFDTVYFVSLPLVAAGLILKISPNIQSDAVLGLGGLAILWAMAAISLYALKLPGASRHAVVSMMLSAVALFCFMDDLPWLLLGVGLSLVALIAAPRLNWPNSIQNLASGAMLLFGMLDIIDSSLQITQSEILWNHFFVHRMVDSGLMMVGAWLGMRRSIGFAKILGVVGALTAGLSVFSELLRLQIDFLPQLVYGLTLGIIFLEVLLGRKRTSNTFFGALLLLVLICSGWWAAHDATMLTTSLYFFMTPIALLGLAWSGRDLALNSSRDFSSSMAIGLLPFAMLPWASYGAQFAGVSTDFFEATIAMMAIGLAAIAARLWLSESRRWNDRIQPLHVYLVMISLLLVTLFHIERGFWPFSFEFLALSYLVIYVKRRSSQGSEVGFGIGTMTVLAFALVMQAMLLRLAGPAGIMDASDINHMHLPAVASLMWAIFGAGLTWWGTFSKSRTMWSSGAVLLVVAAVKLMLFDFAGLGQLGNIFAFIGAGLVFLGVAWFAPIPPKSNGSPRSKKFSESIQSDAGISNKPQMPVAPEENVLDKAQTSPQSHMSTDGESQSKLDLAMQADIAKLTIKTSTKASAKTGASTYKPDTKGVNFFWLALLACAILFALFSSAQKKHTSHQKAMQEYRLQIDELNRQEQAQSGAEKFSPEANTPAPTLVGDLAQTQVTVGGRSSDELVSKSAKIDTPIKVVDACSNFIDQLPSEYVLYAGGAYGGLKLGRQIDQSGHEATQFDVFINAPGKKVVLALGAYEPSVWDIRWTPGTVIAAVFSSGYHRQAIAGLAQDVPVLYSSSENKTPCGYFYINRNEVDKADLAVRKIFGRSAQTYFMASEGRINFGNLVSSESQFIQNKTNSVDSYRDKTAPPAGLAGLEQLIREGKLRPANNDDVMAWRQMRSSSRTNSTNDADAMDLRRGQSYVVLKPMRFPSGLYGANSAVFFIDLGIPRPEGDPGHSRIFDMNRSN